MSADDGLLSDNDVGLGSSAPSQQPSLLSDEDVGILPSHNNTGPLANSADDGILSGTAKGAGTAAVKGLSNIPGTPGNLSNFADYLVARGESGVRNAFGLEPKTPEQIMSELRDQRAQQEASSWLPTYLSRNTLPGGEQIAAPVLAKTGEYQPASLPGRMAQTGLETAIGMIGPGGGAKVIPGAAGAGANLSARAAPTFAGEVKDVARNAVSIAPEAYTMGSLSQGATDLTDDPLLGMAVGIAGPAAGKAIGKVAKPYTDPLFGNKQQIADQRLLASTSNPQKAIADSAFQPQEIVPGSKPTTGELTGDTGLLQAQKAAAAENPEFRADLLDRQGAQNVGQRRAIDAMAPVEADKMAPSRLLQQHLDDLESNGQAAVNRLSQGADALNSRIPGSVDPDVSGAQLRHAVSTVGDEVRQAKNRLYDAVDPDGTLAVVTSKAASAAKDLKKSIDPAVSIPSPFLSPIIDMVANLREVTPFKKLISLDQTISSKMSEASRAGDNVGHAQLVQLKGAVKDAINYSVDAQHEWEQGAVSRGELSPEDTFVARMIRERDDTLAPQRAGQTARASNGRSQPSGDSFFPSRAREKVSDIGRHGSAPGDQGISPPELQPNVGGGAAQRIKTANSFYADYNQTYKQGPVGQALKTNGFAGQYTTPNSGLVQKAFPPGDKGYEAVKAFTRAGKNSHDTVGALQDMAVTRLREIMKGQDRVSPHTLETWKQRYGQALRGIDEVSPGFSRQFDDAARASDIVARAQIAHADRVAEAKKGAVAPFLKANHPDEVKANVGKLLAGANGPTQIKTLLGRMGGNMDAIEGLRRAGVEHLLDKFSTAATAGGERVLSGAELGDFLAKHGGALETLYGAEGLRNMRLVAADQARFQRAADAVKAKGGSDTGQNTIPFLKKMVEAGHSPSIGALAAMEGLEALHEGSLDKAFLIGGGVGLKAYIGKKIGQGNEAINHLYMEGLLDPEIGSAMLRRAFERDGTPNKGAWNALSGALARSLYRTRAAFPAINKDQNEN